MPIYEYECTDCANTLEALQKMADKPLEVCPACDKSSLRKKISAVGFRLSGSGWYETDFKSKNQKNIAGDGASKASKEANSTATKSKSAKESKPSAGSKSADS